MGLIALEGMKFHSYIGFYSEEKIIGNNFLVDVYINIEFLKASQNDTMEGTINYEKIMSLVKEVMSQKDIKLLEHAAQLILQSIRKNFPSSEKIKIRLSKLNPPVSLEVNKVFIEIED